MSESTIYGWTMDEWAIAFALFPVKNVTHRTARAVRTTYLRKGFVQHPEAVSFIGVEYERDYDSAVELFSLMPL